MKSARILIASLIVPAGSVLPDSSATAGERQYEVVEIPVLPGFPHPRTAGMNSHGHVVGGTWACPFILSCLGRAFLYDGSGVQDFTAGLLDNLPPENIGITRGVDINDEGDAIFWLTIVDVGVFPYLYHLAEVPGGPDAPFFEITGPPEATSAVAWDINNDGVVAGAYSFAVPPDSFSRAFTWTLEDGVVDIIEPPVGFASTEARGINDAGDVVGTTTPSGTFDTRGFMWSNGIFTVLEPLPGHARSEAVAVNDAGLVVGTSSDAQFNDSLVIWSNGGIVDSLTLGFSSIDVVVHRISNEGEVVGNYWPHDKAFQPFAFRWTPQDGFQQLDELDLSIPDLNLWESTALNDAGQIVAWGEYPDLTVRGFLLSPVDTMGDLNGDGSVDPADLAILLGSWGPCPVDGPSNCPADLTGDGIVDPADLAILLGNWG